MDFVWVPSFNESRLYSELIVQSLMLILHKQCPTKLLSHRTIWSIASLKESTLGNKSLYFIIRGASEILLATGGYLLMIWFTIDGASTAIICYRGKDAFQRFPKWSLFPTFQLSCSCQWLFGCKPSLSLPFRLFQVEHIVERQKTRNRGNNEKKRRAISKQV